MNATVRIVDPGDIVATSIRTTATLWTPTPTEIARTRARSPNDEIIGTPTIAIAQIRNKYVTGNASVLWCSTRVSREPVSVVAAGDGGTRE